MSVCCLKKHKHILLLQKNCPQKITTATDFHVFLLLLFCCVVVVLCVCLDPKKTIFVIVHKLLHSGIFLITVVINAKTCLQIKKLRIMTTGKITPKKLKSAPRQICNHFGQDGNSMTCFLSTTVSSFTPFHHTQMYIRLPTVLSKVVRQLCRRVVQSTPIRPRICVRCFLMSRS